MNFPTIRPNVYPQSGATISWSLILFHHTHTQMITTGVVMLRTHPEYLLDDGFPFKLQALVNLLAEGSFLAITTTRATLSSSMQTAPMAASASTTLFVSSGDKRKKRPVKLKPYESIRKRPVPISAGLFVQ